MVDIMTQKFTVYTNIYQIKETHIYSVNNHIVM